MQIDLTTKEFRHLLDLVYIGNWILNSTRGEDRFADYDDLESKLFGLSRAHKMGILTEDWNGIPVPSKAYVEGGIHEAIIEYENNIFFDILAEDLARRDMNDAAIDQSQICGAELLQGFLSELQACFNFYFVSHDKSPHQLS